MHSACHFAFACLFVVFVAGCTTVDKQTARSAAPAVSDQQFIENQEASLLEKVDASPGEEPQDLKSKQEQMAAADGQIEALAFDRTVASVEEPQIPQYHLPHASEHTQEMIKLYASAYDVPERLVRRVVRRESHGNPQARNGPYWGLMQISYPTAQSMGYQGVPEGLLDAETNLKYAVKYLAGAYLVAGGDEAQAVRLYARGFYYDAKAKGLLERTGLRPGPTSIVTAFVDE